MENHKDSGPEENELPRRKHQVLGERKTNDVARCQPEIHRSQDCNRDHYSCGNA